MSLLSNRNSSLIKKHLCFFPSSYLPTPILCFLGSLPKNLLAPQILISGYALGRIKRNLISYAPEPVLLCDFSKITEFVQSHKLSLHCPQMPHICAYRLEITENLCMSAFVPLLRLSHARAALTHG